MSARKRKAHTDTQPKTPHPAGQGESPIRCGVVSPYTPRSPLEEGVSATGLRRGNPVAQFDSQSGSASTGTVRKWEEKGRASARKRSAAQKGQTVSTKSRRRQTVDAVDETLAGRRRRIAEEKAAAREDAARKSRPEGTNALGHDEATRRAMGLEVLLSAYVLAQEAAQAWAQGYGGETPRNFVLQAGDGGIAGHYALVLLGWVEERPHSYAEVLALLALGIARAGGTPPAPLPPPKPPRKRPGPKVSTKPPSPQEVARRRALYASAVNQPQGQQPRQLAMLATANVNWCVRYDEAERHRPVLLAALQRLTGGALAVTAAVTEWAPAFAQVA